LKWAKSASVKAALREPQEVRAHCDRLPPDRPDQETGDFWPPRKSQISRGRSLSMFLVCRWEGKVTQISKTGDVAIILAMSVYLELRNRYYPTIT